MSTTDVAGVLIFCLIVACAMRAIKGRRPHHNWQDAFDVDLGLDVWDDFDEDGARRSQAAHPSNQQGKT